MSEAQTLEDLIPNAMLGHYQIIEHVAEGGMGHVFKCFEASLQREVAIKVLKEELAQDPDKLVLFDQEAQNIAALRHPNIVPIYFVGHHGELHYFVMPFISGSTLDDWVESDEAITVDYGNWVMHQAIEALAWAYDHNIIHLDIKPSNFLIDDSGAILLTDFGLARTLGQKIDTDEDECYGTPAYMCPEQILQQETDQRSDIYSLGATMYHLMTNNFLFDCETVNELVRAHLERPFPYEEAEAYGLSPGWINLFDRMTQKKQEDRFQNYEELRDALANVDRLAPVSGATSREQSEHGIPVSHRSGAKEDLYGILDPKFSDWADSVPDQGVNRERDDIIEAIKSPSSPLRVDGIVKSLEEIQKASASDVSDLAEALNMFPEAEEYVIALANTSFVDPDRPVKKAKKAVRLVGVDLTRRLILTSVMFRTDFKDPPEFTWFPLWQHSITVGVLATYLIDIVLGNLIPGEGREDEENKGITSVLMQHSVNKARANAYFSGLIHDIGKMVLGEVAPYGYYAAMRRSSDELYRLSDLENHFFSIDHGEVGDYWLALHGFDSATRQIAQNHGDLEGKLTLTGAAVALANQLAKLQGYGFSGNGVIDTRSFWRTQAWETLMEECEVEPYSEEDMETHFIPMVAELPTFQSPIL